jgi:uncharacterized FlgJ-related protein
MFAQAKHESANFTSNLYKLTNNCFGMTHPVKRPAVGYESKHFEGGNSRPLQAYRNDTESFVDLMLWMDYTKFPETVANAEQYVSEMKKRGYFTASEASYLKAFKKWL